MEKNVLTNSIALRQKVIRHGIIGVVLNLILLEYLKVYIDSQMKIHYENMVNNFKIDEHCNCMQDPRRFGLTRKLSSPE